MTQSDHLNASSQRYIFQRIERIPPTVKTSLIWLGLGVVVFIFYSPILKGSFLADDYVYLAHLLEKGSLYLHGEELKKWFFDFNGIVFLRPVIQWLWLTDYAAWYTNASGYYFTNIILHWLNACLVYTVAKLIIRGWWGALAAALFFILHPIHADSVAWVSDQVDLLAALFCLLSASFYILYRQRSRTRYLLISILAFVLAVLTKESALTLPAILIGYDFLFTFPRSGWRMVKTQLIIVALIPAYIVFRLFLFNGFGGYRDLGFLNFGLSLFLQYYTLALAKPFLVDMNTGTLVIVFALFAVLMIIYHRRKSMWLGITWTVLAFLPAGGAGYVAPRLVYIPSIGWAFAEAAILSAVLPRDNRFSRAISIAFVLALAIAYGLGLSTQVDNWATAGKVTASIQTGMQQLHPTFPANSKVFFAGIPTYVRGIDIYAGNFPFAVRDAYHGTPSFQFSYAGKFPIVASDLEQSYFLEYVRQKVNERQDVRQALLERRRCLSFSSVMIEWDFRQDAQGWEPWNELDNFETRAGALFARSVGNDPYMASPLVDIPAMEVGDVEITLQVHGNSAAANGALYWRTVDSNDFSPAFTTSFPLNSDGEFHTYRIDLNEHSQLFVGDRIQQLRLDPIDAPAEIQLQSIRVYGHCSHIQGSICLCQ